MPSHLQWQMIMPSGESSPGNVAEDVTNYGLWQWLGVKWIWWCLHTVLCCILLGIWHLMPALDGIKIRSCAYRTFSACWREMLTDNCTMSWKKLLPTAHANSSAFCMELFIHSAPVRSENAVLYSCNSPWLSLTMAQRSRKCGECTLSTRSWNCSLTIGVCAHSSLICLVVPAGMAGYWWTA